MVKLGAKELRTSVPNAAELASIKKNPIYIILDNVLDTYNVGSIFRLADAVAAEKVFLCGETLTPPNPRIKKASINTWNWVEWEYAPSAKEALESIRFQEEVGHFYPETKTADRQFLSETPKLKIICVEQDPKSIPYTQMAVEFPLAVIVGNETHGISKEVLAMADQIVEIPMWGVNKSLNVMVSLGIVLFKIMEEGKKENKREG